MSSTLSRLQPLLSLAVVSQIDASTEDSPFCEIDVGSTYTSSLITKYDAYTSNVRSIYGAMNGPMPVPIVSTGKPFSYEYTKADEAQYLASFKKLGHATVWTRYNDVGVDEMLSLTYIFSAWPRSEAELEAADVNQLADTLAHYNFSGVLKHVVPAIEAGRNIDWRIGDGHTIAALLTKGVEVLPGVKFPKAWKFATNYKTPKGLQLYAAVAAKLANFIHQAFLGHRVTESQKLYFDVLTETATPEDCVFWPGTAQEYAALFGAVVKAIKAVVPASENIKYVGPNTALGKNFGKTLPPKRVWFQEFLRACDALGPEDCPLDVVAFHPFSPDVSDYVEMMQFVYDSVHKLMPHFGTNKPTFALTAWAQHGSGMFDTNDSVAGANLMADILIKLQDFPLEFSIYYKFDGVNTQKPWAPGLALLDGVLKPNAMPLVLLSRMLGVSQRRKMAKCTNGDSIIGVAAGHRTVSAVLTGAGVASNPQYLRFPSSGCTGDASTLMVETVASSEDVHCTSISDGPGSSKTCLQGDIHSMSVAGTIYSDGFFHADANSSPFALSLGDSAYVARVTLSCGGQTAEVAITV